jgi:hypothetical protein
MRLVIHKPRTDNVKLSFVNEDEVEKITLTTKEFHALIKALKFYDHKKWDEGSLILATQELKL